ncbi:MAG: ketopantoate reductase family protein [Lachnospiraceae bacterium]|nr:ketopantoate reductase family protein [Lachnospiraceae bacterium]
MKINTVGIIGRGALGVMYGKCLTDSLGSENVFFIADEERIMRYQGTELLCNGERCRFSYRTPAKAIKADLLIFAVKFMGLRAAIEAAGPFVGENTLMLSVLNGISSEQLLEEAFGSAHVLYACVQGMDAGKDRENVMYKNVGYISVGNKDKSQDERLLAVAKLFERAGLAYEIPDDVVKKQWSKLMLNTGVNQVTAVYGAPYAAVQKEGEARTMMIEAMKEVQRVAAYQDVELTDEDLTGWLSLLDTLNPEGFTSMCQDMRAGRKTEVELFSGTMLKLAKEAGIALPVNEFLYERIRELEGEGQHA